MSGHIKEGFSLDKKYDSSLDLKPNVHSYADVFTEVIVKNNIHEEIRKATGIDLHLAHIQLRIAYPSPKGAYISWHRDTHLYKKGKVTGNIPPAYKLNYYPVLDQKVTDQLGVIPQSHNFIFNSKFMDMAYARLAKQLNIKSSNEKFVFFNTALLHKAMNTNIQTGSARLIYSFVRKDQISGYGEEVFNNFNKFI
jgi:hypothetical protein